jgi:hypothetical protein
MFPVINRDKSKVKINQLLQGPYKRLLENFRDNPSKMFYDIGQDRYFWDMAGGNYTSPDFGLLNETILENLLDNPKPKPFNSDILSSELELAAI